MEFKDEEILKTKKLLEEAEKESKENEPEGSIYDEEVSIIGEKVSFERRVISELKVSIYMPKTFFLFTDDIKKLIYPAGNAPSHVFGGENINFQMLLSQTVHAVPDSGIKEFINVSSRTLEAVGPKVTIVEKKVIEKTDFHIGILSFVSRAVDMMVYNMQYYVSINGRLLMGSVTFPSKYKKRMIPLAYEIIESLEIIKEELDGNNILS